MSDKKITELSAASSLTSDDVFVLVNDNETKKTTLDAIKSFVTAEQFYPVTYAELADLKAAGELTKGAVYYISDRNIWLQAIDVGQVSLTGHYLRRCPKYELIASSISAVWTEGGTFAVNNRVIWNNLVWKSLASANSGNLPDEEESEWWVLESTASGTYYKDEIYACEFDFANDWIQLVHDVKRGNCIGGSRAYETHLSNGFNVIERFPWGNDSCYGNTAINALLNVRNAAGQVRYVNVGPLGVVNNVEIGAGALLSSITLSTGAALINMIINGALYSVNIGAGNGNGDGGKIANKTIDAGIYVGNMTIGNVAWDATETISSSLFDRRLESGFSNFEYTLDLDDAGIFSAGVLTIPTVAKNGGVFILTGASSAYTIDKIASLPGMHKCEFRAENGRTITFTYTAISGISANDITLENAADFVLTGRTGSSDALMLVKEGTYSRQVGHSTLLDGAATVMMGSLSDGDIPYFDGSLLQPGPLTFESGTTIRLAQEILLSSYVPGKTQIDFGGAGDEFIVTVDGGDNDQGYLKLADDKFEAGFDSSAYYRAEDGQLSMIAGAANLDINPTTINFGTAANPAFTFGGSSSTYQFNAATASRAVIFDSSKQLVASSVTNTELGYMSGVTSAVQTQINARELLSNKATDFSTINNTLYPTVQAVQNAITTAVAGLLDYRGGYDASGNAFPSSGGSGSAGAILKGDFWFATVAGTLGGTPTKVGDMIIANTDTPGTTAANWDLISVNLGYVAANVANPLSQFAATTSAQLAGVISDETGYSSGALLMFSKSPSVDAPTITGHATIEGETLTGVTGTGKLVLDASPTITGHATIEGQTLTGVTGTGKLVLDASPTITGHATIEGVTATGATGTGKFVFDTSPTLSNPVVGTQSAGDNSTKAASTAYVDTGLALKENTSAKGAASGYAPLDSSSKVPLANMMVGMNYVLARTFPDASAPSGTAENIITSFQVNSGVVAAGDNVAITFWHENTSNANNKTWRIYINSSNSLSGAVLIGTSVETTNAFPTTMSRTLWILTDTTLYCGVVGTFDSTSGGGGTSSDTKTVTSISGGFYVIVSAQKAVSGDTAKLKGFSMSHQKMS